MKPIAILAAVPQEISLLEQTITNPVRTQTRAFRYLEGTLGTFPISICVGGVGKINAAAAASAIIERVHPGLLINTGCAGAYHGSGLAIGDLAVASHETLGDEGVITSNGWSDLHAMNLPSLIHNGRRYYNELPLSKHAAERAMQVADYCGIKLLRGYFVTVSTCSGTRKQGDELARRFKGICENMEGAAVAQICLRYGVNCMEIRGISNLVDERDMEAWDIPRAVEAAQRFVLKYIEAMDRPKTAAKPTIKPTA